MATILFWLIILALVPAALYGLFLVIAAVVGLLFWIGAGIWVLIVLKRKDPPDDEHPKNWSHQ